MKFNQLSKSISLVLLTSTAAQSAEFIVISNADNGGGLPFESSTGVFEIDTLRSAIEQADNENLFPGADTIRFDESIFSNQQAQIDLNLVGDSFTFAGSLISNSAFGVNSEITVAGPLDSTLALAAGDLRHFQVNEGGQLNMSHVTLDGGNTPNNSSGRGGAIYVREGAGLNLTDSILTNNVANSGGAININSESVASFISNSLFMGNSTTGSLGNGTGGAVFKNGIAPLYIELSTFAENHANYSGGAVFTSGNLIIHASTLNNNSARRPGGGIDTNNIGYLTLVNSSVSNNVSESNGGGVSIATEPGEGINVFINSTITDNHSYVERNFNVNRSSRGGGVNFNTHGGGLISEGYDNVLLHNTLITNNVAYIEAIADDITIIALPESSHNLFGAADPLLGLTDGVDGNQIGTSNNPINAQLSPLADHGGVTLTHLPLPGSPVIDAGNNELCDVVDQRGRIRPQDGDLNGSAVCDIGAVEVGDIEDVIFTNGFEGIEDIIFINGFGLM